MALSRFAILACGAMAVPAFLLAGCGSSEEPESNAVAGQEPSRPSEQDGRAEASEPASGIRLVELAPVPGIDMTITSGRPPIDTPTGNHPDAIILEVKGAGLALIDFDNDGDDDLFVPNGATIDSPYRGPGARLFRNDGGFQFTDVTDAVGLDHHRWSMGAAVADYDGDGDDDIYVSCFGANALLRNDGSGRFTDVSADAGVDDDQWSACATWGDIDNDGDLDLYVVNYVEVDPAEPPKTYLFKGVEVFGGPIGLNGAPDVLYENLGDGTFRDITESSGCAVVKDSYGLNAIIVDADHDGFQDIMVGNDSMPNFLFHNNGDGTFTDVGERTGFATNFDGSPQATMGMTLADLDGNGFADLFSTNFANDTNTLHMNRDGAWFDDQTRRYGLALVSRPYLGWACPFVDFDHDGDEDLLVINGHVFPQATVELMGTDYAQESLLFERDGARFERVLDVAAMPWLDDLHCDRTAVTGDLDRDGDIDVLIAELNGPIRALRNDAARAGVNDWVSVTLRDERPGQANRHVFGARLMLETDAMTQRRWIVSGGGFMCTSSSAAHFGLGSDRAIAGRLTVTWPDGTTTVVEELAAGTHHMIRRAD